MGKNKLEGVKGFLFDLDGVLVQDGKPIPGAIETLRILEEQDIPFRVLTNRTTRSQDSLFEYMQVRGFPLKKEEIFSAPQAAVHFLGLKDNPSCFLVIREGAKKDFSAFPQTDDHPEYVILGDMGDHWDYNILNNIFRMVMDGATLIALHKGRYWREKGALRMDIGVFVAGLEYITGKEALVMGKPSPHFFNMALDDLGMQPHEVAMLGDDILSDVGGAQKMGLTGILVMTGKYSKQHDHHYDVAPDITLPSVAELKDYL